MQQLDSRHTFSVSSQNLYLGYLRSNCSFFFVSTCFHNETSASRVLIVCCIAPRTPSCGTQRCVDRRILIHWYIINVPRTTRENVQAFPFASETFAGIICIYSFTRSVSLSLFWQYHCHYPVPDRSRDGVLFSIDSLLARLR